MKSEMQILCFYLVGKYRIICQWTDKYAVKENN